MACKSSLLIFRVRWLVWLITRCRFRWVVCQLDTLRRSFPTNIQRILKELPMTLDETYERILLEIDKEKREHAIRIFQCLAFSRRPLRAKELAEVLAIQFDTTIPTLNTSFRPKDAHEAVLSTCSSLVTITKLGDHHDDDDRDDTGLLQFSHYSVKEFLTSERLANSKSRILSPYYISPKLAHATLAQSGISTLLQLENDTEDITYSFPLAKYAAGNWFHHAQCDDVAPCLLPAMECLFDPARKHFAVWVSIHDIDHVFSGFRLIESPTPPALSPLYYAVLCGIGSLVEYLINTLQQDPNKSSGGRGTPLHAAAILGHVAIARILLDHNADVNSRDEHNSTPLHEASGSGNLDVMQLLLGRDADVNVFDDRGDSPLYRASRYQKFDAANLLIRAGVDVNVRDKFNSTPLHEASRGGNLDVVQLLLSLRADVDAFNHWGDSPLHEAVRHRVVDAVDLLIRGGADVNVRDKFNSTPLHEASEKGDLDITRLLLGHGADVNVFDDRGDSPLHKALRFRKSDVAELLIEGGADVDVRDKPNSTRLHETSGIGNPKTAQLSHGTAQGLDHKTPLHSALCKGESRLLIEHEADVDAKNDEGHTPASAAHGKLLNDSVPGENMAGTSCVNLPLPIFNFGVVNHRAFSLYLDNDCDGGGDGSGGNGGETLPLSASNFSPKTYRACLYSNRHP